MKKILKSDVEVGNDSIHDQIYSEIETALNAIKTVENKFVVNDTIWHWKNPAGKIKPTVVNSAKFVTGIFQSNLKSQSNWIIEKRILRQDVDAYKEFEGVFRLFTLKENKFISLLEALEKKTGKSSGPLSTSIYNNFCRNGASTLDEYLKEVEQFFEVKDIPRKLRVAVEFETGNIASSFRAANKLEYLYQEGSVDLGIFITSIDKPNCAARIWPASNRNGSFQELEKRGFGLGLSVPLWEIGFQPDSFNKNAPYLGDNQETYHLKKTNEKITIDNVVYEIWIDPKMQQRLKESSD